MTDWGAHLIGIVQLAFHEQMPVSVFAHGGKFWLDDDSETPDTLEVSFTYPGAIATFENRYSNAWSGFLPGENTAFHGSEGTIILGSSSYRFVPEGKDKQAITEKFKDWNVRGEGGSYATNSLRQRHMTNFFECIRTREKPLSDIENGVRTTTACLLGNAALRSGLKLDWNDKSLKAVQPSAERFLNPVYRAPWKLTV